MLKVTEKAALMGDWKSGRDDEHCQVKDNVDFSSPLLGTGSKASKAWTHDSDCIRDSSTADSLCVENFPSVRRTAQMHLADAFDDLPHTTLLWYPLQDDTRYALQLPLCALRPAR
jgi:hypothetical protein